jgi:exosortase
MLLAVLAAAGAAVLLYAPTLVGLARQWTSDPAASHGLLLAGAAAFVAFRRSSDLRAIPLSPRSGGLIVATVAMLIYLAGSLAGDLFVQRVSLPIAITGAVLAGAGTAHFRTLFPAVALFTLAIPLPAIVVTYLTLPLQLVSSQIAADMLQASGMNVLRQGNLLVLDRISLEVAEACSGLQSLLSLGSVAAVGAALLPLDRFGRMVMFASVVPIAIIGNGLRVAATGWLTTWVGEMAVKGVVHDATGYVAFLVMCAGMFSLLWFSRPSANRESPILNREQEAM